MRELIRYGRSLRRFWGTALAGQLEYQLNVVLELLDHNDSPLAREFDVAVHRA